MFIFSSRQVDAYVGEHPRQQVRGWTLNLRQHFDGAARWIHDRADIDYFGGMLGWGSGICRGHGNDLPLLDSSNQPLRQGKFHLQRSHGSDPEQTVAGRNLLAYSHIASSNDSVEGRDDAGFLLLQ